MGVVRELGRPPLHQVGVPLAAGIVVDAAQVRLAQCACIHFAVHEHLLAHETIVHYQASDSIKEGAVLVPIRFVSHEGFGVALDELLQDIGAVVPELGVLHARQLLHAHSVHLSLAKGHHGSADGQGGEIGHVLGAVVDEGIVIGDLHAHGILEEVAVRSESLGLRLVHVADQVVVLLCSGDGLTGDRAVLAVVLVIVEHPLQAGGPVVGSALGHLIAVDVHPGHVVPKLKGPGQAIILSAPLGGHAWDVLPPLIDLQQGRDAVDEEVQVLGALTIKGQQGLHLASCSVVDHKVLDRLRLGLRRLAGGGRGLGGTGVRRRRGSLAAGRLAAAASAGGQDQHRRKQKGEQPHSILFHLSSSNSFSNNGVPPDASLLHRAFRPPVPAAAGTKRARLGSVCLVL